MSVLNKFQLKSKFSSTKMFTIIIYFAALIVISNNVFGLIIREFDISKENDKILSDDDKEIEKIALSFYEDTDKGKYEELYNLLYEGKWVKNDKNKKEDYCVGIVNKDEFIDKVKRIFGNKGEKISFSRAEVLDIKEINFQDFSTKYPREKEILKYVIKGTYNIKFYLAKLKGSALGACGIFNWQKDLPIISFNKELKVILPGNVENYGIIYRFQWIKNLTF